jgi:hypothetical protein
MSYLNKVLINKFLIPNYTPIAYTADTESLNKQGNITYMELQSTLKGL